MALPELMKLTLALCIIPALVFPGVPLTMTLFYVIASYLALGALAGTVAGLFGIGGGLIIVPVLMFSFGLQGINPDIIPHLAVGTSLATIVFTSVSSIRSHNKHVAVRWDLFRPMTVGIVAGALVGAWTASLLSGRALELVIGIFVILVGLKMFSRSIPNPVAMSPASPVWALPAAASAGPLRFSESVVEPLRFPI